MANRKAKAAPTEARPVEARAEMPIFGRSAEFRPDSYRESDNSIEVVWAAGARVKRYDWRSREYYEEVLDMKPEAVRLNRLNAGAPFLDSHNSWSLASVLGAVVPGTARIENGRGIARVQLSKTEGDAERVQKIRDGIVRNISVGYVVHRVQKTSPDEEGGLAEWRALDWEPYEISAVPIPADAEAQVRSAPGDGERVFPCVIVETHQPAGAEKREEKIMDEDENIVTEEVRTAPAAAPAAAVAPKAEARTEPAIDQDAVRRAADDAAAAAVRAERERSTTIIDMAERVGFREFGEQHARSGTDLEAFRTLLINHIAEEQERSQPRGGGSIGATMHVGDANPEQRSAAMTNALLHRANPGAVELTPEARDFRGLSMLELARDLLEARGIRTRGMSRLEVAQRALEMQSRGGLHSTSDFAVILSNVANVTLRAAYEAAPQTFRPLVRVTTVSDFKQVTRAQLGEAPSLEKVGEHGEFTRGSIGDAGESYRVETFGRIVGVTRQVIINDDLDALTRLPRAFGTQAAQLESDLVWGQILSNPTMGDGKTLFHAGHKNLGNAGAIAVDTVAKGRLAISQQTGLDGKTVLNLAPTYIIAPGTLVLNAEQLLGQIYAAKTDDAVPDSMKKLQLISDPRLDLGIARLSIAGSASAWYMAASPSQIDMIELAYLEGNQGVYTETRQGFDIDGVEIKVRLDVGAKVIDHRGFYKVPGA